MPPLLCPGNSQVHSCSFSEGPGDGELQSATGLTNWLTNFPRLSSCFIVCSVSLLFPGFASPPKSKLAWILLRSGSLGRRADGESWHRNPCLVLFSHLAIRAPSWSHKTHLQTKFRKVAGQRKQNHQNGCSSAFC